jgi:hypothetical protein
MRRLTLPLVQSPWLNLTNSTPASPSQNELKLIWARQHFGPADYPQFLGFLIRHFRNRMPGPPLSSMAKPAPGDLQRTCDDTYEARWPILFITGALVFLFCL